MSQAEFEIRRAGAWTLRVRPETWSAELWTKILIQVDAVAPSKHPYTLRLDSRGSTRGPYYLKIYSPSAGVGQVKDWFRDSKAVRAWKQGEALSRLGFHVPPVVAVGEERSLGTLARAFLLTSEIPARRLATVLRERFAPPVNRGAVGKKRQWTRQLARETRRFHDYGFVHGDLVASNILIAIAPDERATFFFMDNDRTRRYPRWLPHRLWRRNLVQLNRIVLPGISLQDRMRFLRTYLGEKPWGRSERRLAQWLERTTRKRRKACGHIESKVSFRELMRWNGPFAKNL